jgi:hypothetical protein
MTFSTITIPLDSDAAQIYSDASLDDQKKMRLLLSLWLRGFAGSSESLLTVMDRIAGQAQERGLTPEIMESLLNAP